MEEAKKGFFELLSPKSALAVGAIGGVLTLGTIGFVVLAAMRLSGPSKAAVTVATTDGGQNAVVDTPPPVVPKTDRPKVELFVMSYCPYGLQMEKAYMPAWQLLKSKADIDVKFVSYAMHGKKEVDENTRQYCIEKEQPEKYPAYLQCFFAAGANDGNEANYQKCLTSAGIDQRKLGSCTGQVDKQFGITAKYNDQASWLSGRYPIYPVHSDLNDKYGVQGSPTLVINGVQANAGRSPEAVKQAICNAFNTPPSECNQQLSPNGYGAGFGLAVAAGNTAAAAAPGCGT